VPKCEAPGAPSSWFEKAAGTGATGHAYVSVREARTSIGRYLGFYNSIRPHSSLKALTPDQVYFNRLPESMAA
jgi:transposase InsO family protein